jgi:prepilin-type processing-associated H-X9-DG protein
MRKRNAATLVEVLVILAIIGILTGLLFAAVQKLRSLVYQTSCLNNLRQIGVGLHAHHGAYRALPPGVAHPASAPGTVPFYGPQTDPYPLLNWHGRVLPFIEQDGLWSQTQEAFAQDRYLINVPPHVGIVTEISLYLCPADGPRATPGGPNQIPATTSYLGVSGTNQLDLDGVLYLDSRVQLTDILDGTSQTVIVGERPASLDSRYGRWYGGWGPWGTTNGFLGVREIDIDETALSCNGPYHFAPDQLTNPCSRFHFWSLHPDGGNFLFADGSARFFGYSADSILPALATRSGGENATLFD